MAAFTMTDTQQVDCTIAYADKHGHPTSPPPNAGIPSWTTDNTELLLLTPSNDGMTCNIKALGTLGAGVVTVKVADTSGNPIAAGSLDFTIISGAPINITVTPGTPTEQ